MFKLFEGSGLFVKMATFGAGIVTIAVGSHKLADQYLEPEPAYKLISVEISKSNTAGIILIDVIKSRPECTRKSASVFVNFKDGTSRGYEVDMGFHLAPGRHTVRGTIIDGPLIADIDKNVPVIFQTRHDCGESLPPVAAFCNVYFEGDKVTLCGDGSG